MSEQDIVVINGSTPLIKLETKEYPRYYRNLKSDNTQTIFSSDTLPVSELAEFGYAVVNDTPPPVGDIVTQGEPVLNEDGQWYQTWTVTDSDKTVKFNEQRAALLKEALEQIETELTIGLPFTRTVGGSDVTFHLQAATDDRANWLGLYQVAGIMLAKGDDTPMVLRTYENTFVEFSPADTQVLLMELLAGVSAAYKRYWTYKDATTALTVGDELQEVPDTFLE